MWNIVRFHCRKKDKVSVPVDAKFYVGWWNEENVLVAVATNPVGSPLHSRGVYHIFNSAGIMMVLASTDGRYIYNANQTFRKASGYTIEELSGQELTDISLFRRRKNVTAELWSDMQKQATKGEATVRTKPGELMTCLFSIENIKINDKDYLFAVATDITEKEAGGN
ncbi:MAG: PAS domain-containing protein [Bacteroides graminisolvens]